MRGSETTNWKVYLMSGTWHLPVIGSPTTAGSQCSFYPVRPGLACRSGVSTEARAITRVLFPFIINLHRGQISGHDQYLHALISVQSTEYYCYNILGCYPQAGGSSRVHDKTFHAKAKQG